MKKLIAEINDKINESFIKVGNEKDSSYYKRLVEESEPKQVMELLLIKDRLIALYETRLGYAQEVIDLIAEELDINGNGLYLYKLRVDDRHPIIDILRDYLGKGGDKTKLKKRVAELENENAVLRSLVGK